MESLAKIVCTNLILFCLFNAIIALTNDIPLAKPAKKPKTAKRQQNRKPNIIFILADDLGFSDVGFNGRQYGSGVKTPNLDRLASEGVILNNYYVQHLCAPTRSQLLTGRYQVHTGLQHSNFPPTRPKCMPFDEVTLPEKLREAGYATHMIGKWHLGFQSRECLPTSKGFDTFLGMYLGSGDYYTHEKSWKGHSAYDFHRDTKNNLTVGFKYKGRYSTHIFARRAQNIINTHKAKWSKKVKHQPLFMYLSLQAPHGPLQVPSKYKLPYMDTKLKGDRRTLAAMIYCMDEAVGDIVNELKSNGMYNDTVIIFSSDNGGARLMPSSNWPLRGSKGTLWEGGLRSPGFISSPLLPTAVSGTVSNAFIHVSDWFPTMVSGIAGGNLNGTKPLDGYDVWSAITSGIQSPRTELLHNINPYMVLNTTDASYESSFDINMRAALRVGDWKILVGLPDGRWDIPGEVSLIPYFGVSTWRAPPESGLESIEVTEPNDKRIWLFNISADPYELEDVSENNTAIVNQMLNRLQDYAENMVPVIWPPTDPYYTPADYNDVWGPWTLSGKSLPSAEKKIKQEAYKMKKATQQFKKEAKQFKKEEQTLKQKHRILKMKTRKLFKQVKQFSDKTIDVSELQNILTHLNSTLMVVNLNTTVYASGETKKIKQKAYKSKKEKQKLKYEARKLKKETQKLKQEDRRLKKETRNLYKQLQEILASFETTLLDIGKFNTTINVTDLNSTIYMDDIVRTEFNVTLD